MKPDWPKGLDRTAWILAAYPDSEVYDPLEAIRLAERARELSARRDAAALDTSAVAYAAARRFGEAQETAQEALDRASQTGNDDLARRVQGRLNLYRHKEPYREAVPTPESPGP